jgi:capsular polysaccharide biosynthesis protein
MDYRLANCQRQFKWFKPLNVHHLPGAYATINNVFSPYWWHWLVDCLPRIQLLEKAYPGQRVVLLMPEEMGESFKDSLTSALPPKFEVMYLPAKTWVKVDRMLLPSYLSGRANGHMPMECYEYIRKRVFSKFGLSATNNSTERIYVSRAQAAHRRIVNEEELICFLSRYGFRTVAPETLSFQQQVRLFHGAEVIVSAHGSNWGNILFSGKIKLLVLYPDRVPNTHIFTMAKALCQQHYFIAGNETSEDADFDVELAQVERVLTEEMGIEIGP